MKKSISDKDLEKMFKGLKPLKQVPKSVSKNFEKSLKELETGKKPSYRPRGGGGLGGAFGIKNK